MGSSEIFVNGEDRGIYYSQTDRAIVFLCNHECLEDLYSTIVHENLHQCFEHLEIGMDELQEENIIKAHQWVKFTII